MSELQTYLRTGGANALFLLRENYSLDIKQDKDFPNLHIFSYHQTKSPMGEKIVQESRGIILDSLNNWEIVCRSFNKFFKHTEGHAAKINWDDCIVQEKLDGSLITLYFYNGNWRIATKSHPSGNINSRGKNKITFQYADFFWKTFEKLNLKLPENTDFCYIFEITGKVNEILTIQNEDRLTLIGARNLKTQEEFFAHEINSLLGLNYLLPQVYNFKNLKEALDSFKSKSPLTHEGLVAASKNGIFIDRQKIKHPGYIALHNTKHKFNNTGALELVRNSDISEIIIHYPQMKEILQKYKTKYDLLFEYVTNEYEKYKHISDASEFSRALKDNNVKVPSIMFILYRKIWSSADEYFRNCSVDKLLPIVEQFAQ